MLLVCSATLDLFFFLGIWRASLLPKGFSHLIFSQPRCAGAGMAMSVSQSTILIQINSYFVDCHEIVYRRSWFPDNRLTFPSVPPSSQNVPNPLLDFRIPCFCALHIDEEQISNFPQNLSFCQKREIQWFIFCNFSTGHQVFRETNIEAFNPFQVESMLCYDSLWWRIA